MVTPNPTPGPRPLADKLLAQADGSHVAEAATIILIEAVDGRLLDAVPLLYESDDSAAVDWDQAADSTRYLSGGERRLLHLAQALATGQTVDLGDTITGLDHHNAQVVINAIAHATGWQRSGVRR